MCIWNKKQKKENIKYQQGVVIRKYLYHNS